MITVLSNFDHWIANYIPWLGRITPGILQGFTMALLTILIPLFIASFTYILNFRKTEMVNSDKNLAYDSDLAELDLKVLLDYIVRFRMLIEAIVLSFSLTILWNIIFDWAKLIYLILWFICNMFIILRIVDFYFWIKGEKNGYRILYMRSVKNNNEIISAFKSIWKAKSIDFDLEMQFFECFKGRINKLFQKEKYSLVFTLLLSFFGGIKNRTDLGIADYLEYILLLYYKSSLALQDVTTEEKETKISKISVKGILKTTILGLEEKAFKERLSEEFFEKFKKFIEMHVNENYEIIKDLFSTFDKLGIITILFDNSSEPNAFDGFPKSWAITFQNIESSENKMVIIWFSGFFQWIQRRVIEHRDDAFDEKGKIVMRNLFPGYDAETLSNFFKLIFSYGKDKPMEWVVRTKWSLGAVKSFSEALEESTTYLNAVISGLINESDATRNKTVSFIVYLIKSRWFPEQSTSLKFLIECTKELEDLKFDDNSNEEGKRRYLLDLVKKITEELEKTE
jgi:hypothetical protein